MHSIAHDSGIDLILPDRLAIDAATKQAFSILGRNGIIQAGYHHSCNECVQPYKETANTLSEPDNSNPQDNNHILILILILIPKSNSSSNSDSNSDSNSNSNSDSDSDSESNPDNSNHGFVKMIVIDGIMMGPVVGILFFCSKIILI